MFVKKVGSILLCWGTIVCLSLTIVAQESDEQRLETLENQVKILINQKQKSEQQLDGMLKELEKLKDKLAAEKARASAKEQENEENQQVILEELESLKKGEGQQEQTDSGKWYDRLTLGGYGEIHYNHQEGEGNEQIDIHRVILLMGYRFTDWLQLIGELEFEHALVEDDNGELVLEQLYADFLIADFFNVRVGRFLVPMGIINQVHEPTTFYRVERPMVESRIIPSTWSGDGVGIYGAFGDNLKYELYLSSSLDGSGFSATNGIRGGRQRERPGLNEPGVTGRLDFFPLAKIDTQQSLRFGTSFFLGGLDNGNRGNNPGVNAELYMYSADLQYRVSQFEIRSVFAYGRISNADETAPNVATDIVGFYVEGAWHFWQDQWKTGLLEDSNAVIFVRYEDFNTQYKVPNGVVKNDTGNRNGVTFGLAFYPVSNFVIKVDYEIRNDATNSSALDVFNLGIGWYFSL